MCFHSKIANARPPRPPVKLPHNPDYDLKRVQPESDPWMIVLMVVLALTVVGIIAYRIIQARRTANEAESDQVEEQREAEG